MNRTASPIFVVGSSRSGTTLISHCLRRHPRIHMATETHYFDDLRPKLLRRLKHDDRDDLAQDVIRYFRALDANLYPMQADPDDSTIDPEAFRRLAEQCADDIDGYFEAFCTIQAERANKLRWGEKTPRHIYQLDAIMKRFPQAKVLFMVRDPRAVVASYENWKFEGRPTSNVPEKVDAERERAARSYHPLIITFMWRSGVRSYRSAQRRYGIDRIRQVRYENLVAQPVDTLKNVCAFLDESFSDEMLNVPFSNSSFAELDRQGGIRTGSLERWRESLRPANIATVQRCCRAEMETCGYTPESVGRHTLGVLGNWMTLPWAVFRAVRANRSRIGSLPSYLWRRICGVSYRKS